MKSQPINLNLAITHPSLLKLLQQHIFTALQLPGNLDSIPFSFLQQSNPIIYRCALAFQIASQSQDSREIIAQKLIESLSSVSFSPNNSPLIEVTVKQLEPGWIDFGVSDRALMVWLNHLPFLLTVDLLFSTQPYLPSPNFNPFPCQYAHARCCSLLRLAQRQGLIELPDNNFNTLFWQKTPFSSIPWSIIVTQNPERKAITHFLRITEKLEDTQPNNWEKLATQLSQTILTVERDCRIFGAIAQENPPIIQGRLALISLAQILLKALLQGKMGLWTPHEL